MHISRAKRIIVALKQAGARLIWLALWLTGVAFVCWWLDGQR